MVPPREHNTQMVLFLGRVSKASLRKSGFLSANRSQTLIVHAIMLEHYKRDVMLHMRTRSDFGM